MTVVEAQALINALITTNGQQGITGQKLNDVLNGMLTVPPDYSSLEPYGYLFEENFANLNNWVEVGSDGVFTVASNQLSVSTAGAVNFSNYIKRTYGSANLDPLKITYEIVVGTMSGGSYGPAVGLQSVGVGPAGWSVQWYIALNTGNAGEIWIRRDGNLGVGVQTSYGITVSTGDTLKVKAVWHKNHLIVEVLNTANYQSIKLSYDYNGQAYLDALAFGSVIAPASNYEIAVYGTGPTVHKIQNLKVFSGVRKKVTMLEIGDSISFGISAVKYTDATLDQLRKICYGAYFSMSGSGAAIEDVSVDHIEIIEPQKIVLRIGSNDIAYGTTLVDTEALYETLVDAIVALGYELGVTLFVGTLIPRPGYNDILGFNTWLRSTYTDAVIDFYNSVATSLVSNAFAAEMTNDNIHLSNEGQLAIAETYVAHPLLDLELRPDYVVGDLPMYELTTIRRETVTTVFTIQNFVTKQFNLLLDYATTKATATITFPLIPMDKSILRISCVNAGDVTALTLAGNGKTIQLAKTTLLSGKSIEYIYSALTSTWYLISD